MSSDYVQDIMLKILEKYKEMPYLWNRKDRNYKNKELKDKGFAQLLELFRTIDPNYTIKCMRKKFENMLYNYRKEVKKVNASKQAGVDYIPSLWYYDAISFLPSSAEPCHKLRNIIKSESSSVSYTEEDYSYQSTSSVASAASNEVNTKEEVWMTHQENFIDSAQEQSAMKEEEWEVYGKAIGLQLRDLNPRALTVCQKIISDAIYYAKIGRLDEDSYIAFGH